MAARWVNLIRCIAKTTSRLSSKALHQLFLAVAISKMTYATDIWYSPPYKPNPTLKRNQGSVKYLSKFRSIQRKAAITISGAMHTTAADVLDAHNYILPAHLLLLKVCHRVVVRLASLPPMHPLHPLVQRVARRFIKRYKSLLHCFLHLTAISANLLETILPARRQPSYCPVFLDTSMSVRMTQQNMQNT